MSPTEESRDKALPDRPNEEEELPGFKIKAPKGSRIPTTDSNPFAFHKPARGMLGDVYQTTLQLRNGQELSTVWVNDAKSAKMILNDTETWRKGPATYEPFLSLVPKHLIGVEDELHARLRLEAQKSLNTLVSNGIVTNHAKATGKKLCEGLNEVVAGKTTHWFAQPGRLPGTGEKCAHFGQIDRLFRGAALDVVTGALFGTPWNALNDYSETNERAHALAMMMYELHWRVADFNDRDWRQERRQGAAHTHLNVLEKYIEDEIDARLPQRSKLTEKNEDAYTSMLDAWIDTHLAGRLSREEVVNLCLTFLAMGHENIATALAWCLINLAENPVYQDAIREAKTEEERAKLLEHAFNEAARLNPSVAGLTRVAARPTRVGNFTVPAFTEVAVNMYLIHHDEEIWGEDADEFKPTRCPVVSTQGPPHAFHFGVGSRSCVGRPISMIELNNLLGEILRRFKVVRVGDEAPAEGAALAEWAKEGTKANNMVSLRPGLHRVAFVPATTRAKL